MKTYIYSAALCIFTQVAVAETYHFDPGHTEINFYWNHAGLSEQHGQWKIIEGTVDLDVEDIEATSVTLRIDPKSVDTGVEALDNHLRSADFFDVENHPDITFTSTSVQQLSDDEVKLLGDLTIKDHTKEVSFNLKLNHLGAHPLGQFIEYYEGEWIGVNGSGDILRSDFGVGKFAPTTSDEVRIGIAAELRQDGWPENK